jgi:hypothetical protein
MGSLSVRTRFEVFKRDRFTCSYCGKSPPDVLLEVDHIVPRAAGGSDELTNLTTSCQDCNRGKSSQLLDEGEAPTVSKATLQDMGERIEQAKAYMELLTTREGLTEEQVQRVIDAWAARFGAEAEEREDGTFWVFPNGGQFPERRSIRSILKRLSLADVLDAVDITAGRINYPDSGAVRYFFGVCWRAIREERPAAARPQGAQEPTHEDYYRRAAGVLLQRLSDDSGETTDDLWAWVQRELQGAE